MSGNKIQHIVSKALSFCETDVFIFCNDEEVNQRIRDHFIEHPHLFVLCCLMDKQINADKAWRIPFSVCDAFGVYDIYELGRISELQYKAFFNERRLHRFNDSMAHVFKSALTRIVTDYKGNASTIWEGSPSSAMVVARFLEFEGCGIKIATMAANLLHRALSVQYSDYYSIDISPDVHIMRVMNRLGLLPEGNTNDRTLAIYRAREINPQYPGVLDGLFWNVGRYYCHSTNPSCQECALNAVCKNHGEKRT